MPDADTEADAALRAEILVAAAVERVEADPSGALNLLEEAVAVSPAPAQVRLRIADEPAFAPEIDAETAWRRLVGASRSVTPR
ncbi:MAG: hypothetical protein R3B09_31850 [Nannocystaceae bacterium]